MQITLYIGGPGTGKSFLLNQLRKQLQQDGHAKGYHCFGPTWQSALLIEGETIYSYACCACIQKFKPKKFIYQNVFIDEVFLFSKVEFQKILECCNEDTNLILFGDPFQIRQPTKERNYFYEAVQKEIKVVTLTKYYRSQEDQTLQNILIQYRIDKQIVVKNQFQRIKLNEIKDLLLQGAQIIVGRHKEKEKYLTYISQRFRKDLIYAIDGNQYRKGQYLYTVSKFGAIKQKIKLVDQINNQLIGTNSQGEDVKIDFYTQGGKTYYPAVSAECQTVNVIQGQTLDKIIIDIDSLFETGSFYTAISRVRNIKDIYIIGDKECVFEADIENKYCYM